MDTLNEKLQLFNELERLVEANGIDIRSYLVQQIRRFTDTQGDSQRVVPLGCAALPNELWTKVFCELKFNDLHACSQVKQHWNRILHTETFWDTYVKSRWNINRPQDAKEGDARRYGLTRLKHENKFERLIAMGKVVPDPAKLVVSYEKLPSNTYVIKYQSAIGFTVSWSADAAIYSIKDYYYLKLHVDVSGWWNYTMKNGCEMYSNYDCTFDTKLDPSLPFDLCYTDDDNDKNFIYISTRLGSPETNPWTFFDELIGFTPISWCNMEEKEPFNDWLDSTIDDALRSPNKFSFGTE